MSWSTIVMTVSRCMNARRDGSATAITVSAAAAGEEVGGEGLDRLGCRPLTHADEDRTTADDQHVTALDRRRCRVLVDAAEPAHERLGGEARVEAVDRLEVRRLTPAGRHGHRVEGHPAVDPAGGVPR